MKRITMKEIALSNWRGQNHIVSFNDLTTIEGKNGVGKSSIMKAWFWLLSSYTSAGEVKNNNLFDNRFQLSQETPLASVKAIVEIDGYDYTIEKRARAKFVRKRGTDTYEKAPSDEYIILLDNIETSSGDFGVWVENNICPQDMIPYLLDGSFFVNLIEEDKTKSRKVLENIIGEIKEEDMTGDYSIIREDMKRFPIGAIEERTKRELKPLRDRMEEIPAIIDSKEKTLSEYENIDYNALLTEIETKKKDIERIDNDILGSGKAIEPILGERNKIYELINDKTLTLNSTKTSYEVESMTKVRELERKISLIKTSNGIIEETNRRAELEYNKTKISLDNKLEYLESLEKRREELLSERDKVKERIFTGETCVYCGQTLPDDKLEELRVEFNNRKNKDLDAIIVKGKTNTEYINETKNDIAQLKDILNKGLIVEELESIDELIKDYEIAKGVIIPFEETPMYKTMVDEIEDLKKSLPSIPTNENEILTRTKKSIMESLETLNRRYGLKSQADSLREEIETLKREMKEVGCEIARLEGKIDKCKEYMQERAEIVSYRVNGKLEDCKIDMWSMQKDGTLVPDVVLKGKDGIKYSTLNFSHRIKTCIELQKLFMAYYDVSLPIFIDEASVFDGGNLPKLEEQTILLYASDSSYLIVR